MRPLSPSPRLSTRQKDRGLMGGEVGRAGRPRLAVRTRSRSRFQLAQLLQRVGVDWVLCGSTLGTERKSKALVLVCRKLRVLSPTYGFPTNKGVQKNKMETAPGRGPHTPEPCGLGPLRSLRAGEGRGGGGCKRSIWGKCVVRGAGAKGSYMRRKRSEKNRNEGSAL